MKYLSIIEFYEKYCKLVDFHKILDAYIGSRVNLERLNIYETQLIYFKELTQDNITYLQDKIDKNHEMLKKRLAFLSKHSIYVDSNIKSQNIDLSDYLDNKPKIKSSPLVNDTSYFTDNIVIADTIRYERLVNGTWYNPDTTGQVIPEIVISNPYNVSITENDFIKLNNMFKTFPRPILNNELNIHLDNNTRFRLNAEGEILERFEPINVPF
jgi:hypothetical protein